MTEPVVEVPVTPSFILQDIEYSADGISYDPATAVLMYQWDRKLAEQPRRLVFPAIVDDCTVEVEITRAPRDGRAEVRDGSILLPALYQGEECVGDIAFFPTESQAGPKLPKFKVTSTIRARPKGGG
jgi:hypothetical protein